MEGKLYLMNLLEELLFMHDHMNQNELTDLIYFNKKQNIGIDVEMVSFT